MRKQQSADSKTTICKKIVYNPELIEPSEAMNIVSQSEAVEVRARNMLPSFTFSPDLIKSLQNHISRNQPKDGVVFGTSRNKSKRALSFCLEYLNIIRSVEEEDMAFKIDQEECFCAIFALGKNTHQNVLEKFQYEIAKCRLPPQFKKGPVNEQPIMDEIEKLYFMLLRAFFVFQEETIHKIIYFPNVNIRLREAKLKIKYASNALLTKITQQTAETPVVPTFGYLMPDEKKRIMVIQRHCKNCESWPLMGVWIYAKNFKKPGSEEIDPDKQHLVWALITDYMRRSKFKKVSMFGENKGVFILFTPGGKPTLYIFQCPQQSTANRWALSKSSSKKPDFKEQCIFDTLILEENLNSLFEPQKQVLALRKQISSPTKVNQVTQPVQQQPAPPAQQQPPRRQLPSFSNNSDADSRSDKASQKSYDQKDFEIRVLKDRLEFYKTRTQQLEKMLLNCQQLNPMMFMMNAMGQMNPSLGQNPGMGPSMNQMMSQLNPINGMPPMNMNTMSNMSPMSPLNHHLPPSYYNLYHSAVVPQQQMMPQYASTPQHNAMSQSYVASREEIPLSLGSQTEEEGMDFTKKQNTIEGKDMNPFCTTPMNKLTNSHLMMTKPENIRMNLAEQFSEGNSPTMPTNENSNSTNKPHIQSLTKQQLTENSPKFILNDQSDMDISKQKLKESFNNGLLQEKPDTFELSFKGYPQIQKPLDFLEPPKQPSKIQVQSAQYRNSFMDSCASDTEYHFGSDFVKPVDRKNKVVVDSDSDDEFVNAIGKKYLRK